MINIKKTFVFGLLMGTLLFSVFGYVSPAFAAGTEIAGGSPASVIAFPAGYVTDKEGASSYNGIGNVKNSPYYTARDYYNLESNGSLVILPHYKTYQQTTEITCGPAAALTVLYHYNNTEWDELTIARLMGTKPEVGTDTKGMTAFFKKLGWNVTSSLTAAGKDGKSFATVQAFKEFVLSSLKNNTPVMVENIEWGGHWRVIIGYDTMGTETLADDVLILADSYDTADQKQDGYVVNPVEKFYYMWFDAHMLPKGQQYQQWLVARPPLQ